MDNLSEAGFDDVYASFQPWVQKSPEELSKQAVVHAILAKKAGAKIGSECYISPEARVLTQRLVLGDRSWIAGGAVIRGNVEIGSDCSVNPYAHIAGQVKIGNACRIAGMVSVYGFNHGTLRADIPIMNQEMVSRGVRLHEDVWVGANAVIVDGVEIGPHCVVAAGAVVTKSFPAYKVIGGNPARVLRDRDDVPCPPEPLASVEPIAPKSRVRDLLFSADPYTDYEPVLALDLQGWDSENPLFRKMIAEVKPKLIVEVGTWKGASAIHMAKICRELQLDAEIVCVDTWLGNWQHWARESGIGSRVDLRLKNGFPSLYHQFLTNVIIEEMRDLITPLPLTGIAGAKLFAHYALKPDIIYVDGDHEYESAISDLRGWLPQLADGGVLIGDDYMFPGVQRAVTEIAAESNCKIEVIGNKFLVRRLPLQITKSKTAIPYLSVCAIVKNESDYIYEWLSYHYAIGVESFIIFDNGCTDDTLEVIKSWPNSDRVTVIPWPYDAGQQSAYREMISTYRQTAEWCAFIDVDEFLCPKGPLTVPDVLRSLPADCGALYVHWMFFGSSGYETKQSGLVTETFTKRGYSGFDPNRIGKTILRLRDAQYVDGPHRLHTLTRTLNDACAEVQETEAQDKVSHAQIALHHYFCKSREEWRIRRSLGRVSRPKSDPESIRPDNLFDSHDMNQVFDDDAAKIMQYARELLYRPEASS